MRVGFIGVGAMGVAMAGHVVAKGFEVAAYDTDAAALERAAAAGATPARSLADIAQRAEVLVVMVASDGQSRSVVTELLCCGLPSQAVIVVAATNHPRTMIELAAAARAASVGFVDAPVCYGLQGAKQGDLVSLCGGSAEDVDYVRPVLLCYSRSVEHIGGPGYGQLAKACNNMMHWAACVANYETLALAKACGVDAQAMRQTLLKCPARNTTLERWDSSRFTWQEKDMDVVMELAQQAGLALPLFGLVDQLVKRLGPDQVRALLHEPSASYLGLEIPVRDLAAVTEES
jgi:3-hydroxyisobutyrate dehydrogenase-like beta-hydroxyacid dehydrogenase